MTRLSRCVLFFWAVATWLAPPALAVSRQATAAEKRVANQALLAMQASPVAARRTMERHLLWGVPQPLTPAPDEHVLVQEDYVLWYSDGLRVPLWAAYDLRRQDLPRGRGVNADRIDAFRPDPRLTPDQRAELRDYVGTGLQRGHMAPNADFKRSVTAIVNTFVLSNMCPQVGRFNQNIWSWLEEMVRGWAGSEGHVFVISGPVFDADGDGRRDAAARIPRIGPRQAVALPTGYYKVIAHPEGNSMAAFAILLPGDSSPARAQSRAYLAQHLVRLDRLEALTGIRFFPQLTPEQRRALERSGAAGLLAQTALPSLLWAL